MNLAWADAAENCKKFNCMELSDIVWAKKRTEKQKNAKTN